MFKNKVIIVTGSSSGIGAETALAFAREGASVVITYKENKNGAEEVASKINLFGGKSLVIQADLINELEAKNVIEETKEKFGKLDILVNNAGRYIDGDEWDGSSEIWTKSLSQNLISVMSMSKYAIEIFQNQKSGILINMASRFSAQGQYDALSYSASRAGVVNITQAYAKLLAPFGRANAVSPGAVNTGYWLRAPKDELELTISESPLKKLVEVMDVVNLILFLASDKASSITGQNIFVDGGFNLK
ncbi:MAG: 3-oxoacyl-[acyl-carrier-protein] reductase [Candidatus Moranbacteria bacterium GW2011_GWF2_34_56]|nr:MAG: 3-oxoacyl-[acyl-carrier-protein] reductase [Candidatus Moranbacteria bacterium GW2011_GWF1_34_10]KKP64402.1 MAG: 3-oxoacyl-[acyl-carrier-protein] reductase [Candidatus Moranbacteria bacterium GW2011_GWF2_34_56]HBI17278.1 beta-ketoacyl-ACP reductase [Candidatus Moranbacteria bacterium]